MKLMLLYFSIFLVLNIATSNLVEDIRDLYYFLAFHFIYKLFHLSILLFQIS